MELQGGQEHPGKARETREAQNPFETPGAPERIRKNQKSVTLLLGWLMNISRVCGKLILMNYS